MQGPWSHIPQPETPQETPQVPSKKVRISLPYWFNMYLNGGYVVLIAALVPWMLTLALWFSVPLGLWFAATGLNALANFIISVLFATSSKFRDFIRKELS